MGRCAIARADTRQGLRLYDRKRHDRHALLYGGHDPGVCARGFGAMSAWLTGQPDEAARLAEDGVELGRELGQPFSHAMSLWFATYTFMFRGEGSRCCLTTDELIELSERHALKQALACGLIFSGWASVDGGEIRGRTEADRPGARHVPQSWPARLPTIPALGLRRCARSCGRARPRTGAAGRGNRDVRADQTGTVSPGNAAPAGTTRRWRLAGSIRRLRAPSSKRRSRWLASNPPSLSSSARPALSRGFWTRTASGRRRASWSKPATPSSAKATRPATCAQARSYSKSSRARRSAPPVPARPAAPVRSARARARSAPRCSRPRSSRGRPLRECAP